MPPMLPAPIMASWEVTCQRGLFRKFLPVFVTAKVDGSLQHTFSTSILVTSLPCPGCSCSSRRLMDWMYAEKRGPWSETC